MPEERDWLEAGKRVFVLSGFSTSIATVAKLTARDVVLESGTRYNRGTLTRKLGPYDYERISALHNPESQRTYLGQLAQKAARKVADVSAKFATQPTAEGADAIEEALGAWHVAAQRLKKVTDV